MRRETGKTSGQENPADRKKRQTKTTGQKNNGQGKRTDRKTPAGKTRRTGKPGGQEPGGKQKAWEDVFRRDSGDGFAYCPLFLVRFRTTRLTGSFLYTKRRSPVRPGSVGQLGFRVSGKTQQKGKRPGISARRGLPPVCGRQRRPPGRPFGKTAAAGEQRTGFLRAPGAGRDIAACGGKGKPAENKKPGKVCFGAVPGPASFAHSPPCPAACSACIFFHQVLKCIYGFARGRTFRGSAVILG